MKNMTQQEKIDMVRIGNLLKEVFKSQLIANGLKEESENKKLNFKVVVKHELNFYWVDFQCI